MKHEYETSTPPVRVVILGGAGFVGQHLTEVLQSRGIESLCLGREQLDLRAPGASSMLRTILTPRDAVVVLATITPTKGKGIDAFMGNMQISETVCHALTAMPVAHVIYLSSDTVYPLHRGILSENSPTEPENLYGAMHLSREYMLRAVVDAPLAILRSTLLYGVQDPHNSYGPNRLRRMAQNDRRIVLFGEGEECRDYVAVEDIAALIAAVLEHGSTGILNVATGSSISYLALAQKIARFFDVPIDIICTERKQPITHRHFDVAAVHKAFPSFHFRTLDDGLRASILTGCM